VPDEPPNQQPAARAAAAIELDVSAEFDKPSYLSGDLITVKFRIKNVGTDKIVGLNAANRFDLPNELQFDPRQWGELSIRPGVTVEPGATHEAVLSGHTRNADSSAVTLTGNVFDERGFSVKEFAFSAPVTKRVGQVAGIVFGDKNGNGTFDTGEELSGTPVNLSYVHNTQQKFSAKSDNTGHFDFGQIPSASYFIGGEVVDNWLFPFDIIDVDESGDNSDLRVRGAPPLNGALHATMKFTKDTYKPGELAHVTVTLANSGTTPLVGIVAACNRGGFGSSLSGDGPGWADLAFFSDGVTIAPGQTLKLDVTEAVPDASLEVGHVNVGCDFGYREVDIENHASADDEAKVPGGIATIVGEVQNFPNGHGNGQQGEGVGGVRLVLVDERDCPVVGETTSDDKGHFEFHNLAPGPNYRLFILPPAGWKAKFDNPTRLDVRGGSTPSTVFIEVDRGEGQLPTVPTQPSACTTGTTTPAPPTTTEPAPQGRSSSGLASTGASVVGLSLLGALVLLVGAGFVVVGRRRRKPSS
jgi:LPXTG-motif cell wall-anchored protein